MEKFIFLFQIVAILFFIIILPFGMSAHGGATLTQVIDEYAVNVDYDAPFGIFAGDSVQFTFELSDKDRTRSIGFTDVWVQITPADTKGFFGGPVFSGAIAGTGVIPSGMTFIFPNAGSYTMALRFEKDQKTLAEVTFPLSVAPRQQSSGGLGIHLSDFWKGVFLVLILGVFAWAIRKFFW